METNLLFDSFNKIMNEMKGKYRQVCYDHVIASAGRLKEELFGKTASETTHNWYYRNSALEIVYACFRKEGNNGSGKYNSVDEEALIRHANKVADRDTSALFDGFIAKNTAKMEGILKGLKVEHVDLKFHMHLEGEIICKVERNAGFRMTFKIEYATSKNGVHFGRFPTRFHDVVKTDGVKIKSASEAKMKKEFC